MMNRNLERLAKDRGKVWADSELVFFVYDTVREMPLAAAVAHLQATLSSAALASIHQAACSVVGKTPADSETFGVGWVTPEAPAQFNHVPTEFVRRVASTLFPPPSA
jgi:hypothetical protein